jgi:multidrug resistance efflux pump
MTIAKPQQELTNPLKPLGVPLSNLLNRIILCGAGVGLLAWGLSLMANRVTSVTAAKAFVNGKIVTITSPISGQVQAKDDLDSGKAVTTDQLLLTVKEPLSNSQWLQGLKIDLVTDKAKLEAIEAKIKDVSQSGKGSQGKRNLQPSDRTSVEVEIPTVRETVREVAFNRLEAETALTKSDSAVRAAEQEVKQAEIQLKVAQNHERVAKTKYDKYRFLSKQGALSALSVEEVLNNWRVSQEQVREAKVKIETATVNLVKERKLREQQERFQRLKNGLPQSKPNRLSLKPKTELLDNSKTEALNPELAELQRQKTELEVSIQAKQKAIAQAEKSAMAQKTYPISASGKGVLWEVMVHNGENVNSGQPLLKSLNCQQLWVDAFVNIDDLKRIQIGSPAQVELHASNLKLNGWVKTIRSPMSGESKLGQDGAITPPDVKNQQLAQVRVELEDSQELLGSKQSSAQFCQVGQVAKVNIGQENSLFANLPF